MAWRFYVYSIGPIDRPVYIGKGSGGRFGVQLNRFQREGRICAYFRREKDAYAYEVKEIARLSPGLNKHPGGNGSNAIPKVIRRTKEEIEMDRIGSRVYVARWLMNSPWLKTRNPSEVERIRRVANGPRC